MEYIEIVNRLTGLLLQAEEDYKSIEIIGDKDLIYDIAMTLNCELGKNFFYECEEDDFEFLYENNEVLAVVVTRFNDGVLYFLEEVFSDDGITLESENDTFYILEDVLDEIDTDRLHGEIVVLKERDTNENEEDSIEEELDDIFEEIVEDTLDNIMEDQEDDGFCLHCTIKNAVQRGYMAGYKQAQIMLKRALEENIENME